MHSEEKNSLIRVWTDGSCLGNPGPGGWAYMVEEVAEAEEKTRKVSEVTSRRVILEKSSSSKQIIEDFGGHEQTTNNQMELTAIAEALTYLTESKKLAPRRVKIYTDSNYALKAVTEWYLQWRQNGWRNAQKKPVRNQELIKPILALKEKLEAEGWLITFQWVKGHANDTGNLRVDELAQAAARSFN